MIYDVVASATTHGDKLAAPIRVAHSPRSRDDRGGQIRLFLARGVTENDRGAYRFRIWWRFGESGQASLIARGVRLVSNAAHLRKFGGQNVLRPLEITIPGANLNAPE